MSMAIASRLRHGSTTLGTMNALLQRGHLQRLLMILILKPLNLVTKLCIRRLHILHPVMQHVHCCTLHANSAICLCLYLRGISIGLCGDLLDRLLLFPELHVERIALVHPGGFYDLRVLLRVNYLILTFIVDGLS